MNQNEARLQHEHSILRKDLDYAREVQKENEALKTEVQVMQQHLRRLDPNNTHVYGQFTQLSQSVATAAARSDEWERHILTTTQSS